MAITLLDICVAAESSDGLSPRQRAEDILLGSLGFGEEAKLISVARVDGGGYRGNGCYADGEIFEFECDDELGELQLWALSILVDTKKI